MKIKTRILLISAIVVFFTVFLVCVVIIASTLIQRTVQKGIYADEIVRKVFTLGILTDDYLLHPSNRAREQWILKNKELENLLAEDVAGDLQDKAFLERIRESHGGVINIFSKLVGAEQDLSTITDDKSLRIARDFKERLTSQLLIDLQVMASTASLLSEKSFQERDYIRSIANAMIYGALFILIVFVLGSMSLLYRSIVRPLNKLQKETEMVGQGNLDVRIAANSKDEIGELAAAFDQMTAKLKASYSELESKVHDRTKELEKSQKELKAKLDEVGQLNKFMIDRETRMVELKKQIEKLDQQLAQNQD